MPNGLREGIEPISKKVWFPLLNELTDLFEETVEVHMYAVSTRGVKQNILTMTITQTKYITHHTHDR